MDRTNETYWFTRWLAGNEKNERRYATGFQWHRFQMSSSSASHGSERSLSIKHRSVVALSIASSSSSISHSQLWLPSSLSVSLSLLGKVFPPCQRASSPTNKPLVTPGSIGERTVDFSLIIPDHVSGRGFGSRLSRESHDSSGTLHTKKLAF